MSTICAIATAQGGAIGIIRVSGPRAIAATDAIFRPAAASQSLQDRKPYTLTFGRIVDLNETVDEVLVSVFHAPHSYTGEDCTEIACHGSSFILNRVLGLLISYGCLMAQPGEFTQRAFINGKMDLSQAEAVADLIASTNRASHHIAMSQLRGNFSSRLAQLRDKLLKLTSLLELELDFSDQDVEFADRRQLLSLAEEISRSITSLARSFETGQAVKHGISVAIAGKTNVGKSTLLNQLLDEDRAIVSDIHGTTRDVIEDITTIHGLTFRFIDTAGIRHTTDEIERMGIERTYKKIGEAQVVLWMIDSTPSAADLQEMGKQTHGKTLIIVQNKADMHPTPLLTPAMARLAGIEQANGAYNNIPSNRATNVYCPSHDLHAAAHHMVNNCNHGAFIQISAKHGKGIETLREAIYQAANIPEITENDVVVTNARHYSALCQALESITRVIEGLNNTLPGDLLSEDLRLCIHSLSDIVGGEITSQETLNNVFSHFCIGK